MIKFKNDEQRKLARRNQAKAWKYFGYTRTNHKGLVLHHIDEELMTTDFDRYISYNPEDLVVMTKSEHSSHHHKGKPKKEESVERMVATKKTKYESGELTVWNKGKKGVQVAWNKGLTAKEDSRIADYAKRSGDTQRGKKRLRGGQPKGCTPWNKGLTKDTDPRVAQYIENRNRKAE